LDGFDSVLKTVRKAAAEPNEETSDRILQLFAQAGGLDIIRHLQNHPDTRISKKAVALLERHLAGEMGAIDEENEES
jgi:Atypical Arm repeat